MAEWKLFDGPSYVSTFEFHEHRERAPHLEQPAHRHRLLAAMGLIRAIPNYRELTYSDLGCGDGGLLQLLKEAGVKEAWGYDFHPASAAGWVERGVTAYAQDWTQGCRTGDVTILTEVLEHLERPHAMLRAIHSGGDSGDWLVVSSPHNETADQHAPEHAWAWDWDGYGELVTGAGWSITYRAKSEWSQLILARRP